MNNLPRNRLYRSLGPGRAEIFVIVLPGFLMKVDNHY